MTKHSPLDVLIIYSSQSCHVSTIQDHISSFYYYSRNNVYPMDYIITNHWNIDLDDFDVLVFHYSIVISMASYISNALAQRIRDFRGYKVLFIQDEYRWVDRTVEAMADLSVHVIYTVVNPDVVDKIYHHPSIHHVRRKVVLTGYVPDKMVRARVPPFEKRVIEVGYRARRLPGWYGYLSQEKWLIGERFQRDARAYGLVCDIEHDEGKRLYGKQWLNFVTGCKAMLGTESGVSMIDFTGDVQRAAEEFMISNPDAEYPEIRDRFLEGRDGEIEIRVISPRCFEAAALRTLMILYPGSYSGILEPWRHYVPLERDHGNMAEVVSILRDPKRAQSIIDQAYREVALNPENSYRSMVEEFDRDLVENVGTRRNRNSAREVDRLKRRRLFHRFWVTISLFRLVEIFCVPYRPMLALHRPVLMLHRLANWTINTFVPSRHRPATRRVIKNTLKKVGIIPD